MSPTQSKLVHDMFWDILELPWYFPRLHEPKQINEVELNVKPIQTSNMYIFNYKNSYIILAYIYYSYTYK